MNGYDRNEYKQFACPGFNPLDADSAMTQTKAKKQTMVSAMQKRWVSREEYERVIKLLKKTEDERNEALYIYNNLIS